MKRKIKILCVLSGLLGNKMLSQRTISALNFIDFIEYECIYVDPEDYSKHPSPFYKKWSCVLDLAHVAKKKFNDVFSEKSFDIILVNGYEIAFGIKDLIAKHPTILILDVIPFLAHELLIRTNKNIFVQLRSMAAQRLTGRLFNGLFNDIDYFLPMGQWCRDALVEHYSVSREIIKAIYCPIDLDKWAPAENKDNGTFLILFVGNDFLRKGGDLVLKIYEEYLYDKNISLTIVSNDPFLLKKKFPEGVNLFKNVPNEDMIGILQKTDLLLFPTLKEYLGVVVTEALSCGVPVISRDVGAIKEMIKDGQNGYLLPYESNIQQWADKVIYLYENRDVLVRFSEEARTVAKTMFDLKNYTKLIGSLIQQIEGK